MSDEAVRKEFEAWRAGRETIGARQAWQASRSAAIQECADKLQMFHDAIISNSVCVSTAQYVLKTGRDALLALKER